MFTTVFGALGGVLVIVFCGIYIAAAPRLYRKALLSTIPPDARTRAGQILHEVGSGLRRWMIGRMVAMLAVTVLTIIGLSILGVRLALTLGILAGLLTFVPLVGPVLSAVPAVLLALAMGFHTALWTAGIYVSVQLVENNLLSPMIQRKAVSLPPAAVLLFQLAATTLLGPVGLVMATPLLVALIIIVQMIYVHDGLDQPVELLTGHQEDKPQAR
jgi:predicted PurR-regulated permease PerM